jgi:hypothetical protein
MPDQHSQQFIYEVLAAIIDGNIVKQIKHDILHAGNDLTGSFIEQRTVNGYVPTIVNEANVEPGKRVLASSGEHDLVV